MRVTKAARSLIATSVLLLASLGFLPSISSISTAGAADSAAASQFISLTNSLRASRGLPALQSNGALTAKAEGWAQHMADTGVLAHSVLADGAPGEWIHLGENVGRGGDVNGIHNAFVASASHLKNLVDPGFQYVGIGVVSINGGIFVSEVFMQTESQPAVSSPAPTAAAPAKSTQTGSSRPVASAPRSGGSTSGGSGRVTATPAPVVVTPPPAPEQLTVVLERLRALDG
ncbi:MAG: CAP domain-containing protein [Actinomycetes bacterium]